MYSRTDRCRRCYWQKKPCEGGRRPDRDVFEVSADPALRRPKGGQAAELQRDRAKKSLNSEGRAADALSEKASASGTGKDTTTGDDAKAAKPKGKGKVAKVQLPATGAGEPIDVDKLEDEAIARTWVRYDAMRDLTRRLAATVPKADPTPADVRVRREDLELPPGSIAYEGRYLVVTQDHLQLAGVRYESDAVDGPYGAAPGTLRVRDTDLPVVAFPSDAFADVRSLERKLDSLYRERAVLNGSIAFHEEWRRRLLAGLSDAPTFEQVAQKSAVGPSQSRRSPEASSSDVEEQTPPSSQRTVKAATTAKVDEDVEMEGSSSSEESSDEDDASGSEEEEEEPATKGAARPRIPDSDE